MTRINTNVQSLLAARVMNKNTEALNTTLERLSTGLRINRGKDDPAGLIASEHMRAEMVAINAAISNANRANNMIAVAEGGLQEVNALLLDLENLVGQSANEAGMSSEEVAANQLQIDSILSSINRIASSTQFQSKNLLNGELDYQTSGVTTGPTASAITNLQVNAARLPNGGTRGVVVEVTQSAQTAGLVYGTSAIASGGATIQVTGNYGSEQLSFASGTAVSAVAAAVNASTSLTGVSAAVSGGNLLFNSTGYGSSSYVTVEALAGTFTVTGGDSSDTAHGQDVGVTVNGTAAVTDGLRASLRTGALDLDMTLAADFATQTADVKTFTITGGGADFSIAPTLGVNAKASIGIQNVSTGSLGRGDLGYLSSLGSGQTNQLSSENFETAQRIIRAATSQIAGLRGRLGAFQKNTLEPSVNSLSVALENTTAAESAIRDADFAKETSNLTRAQILVQSSTAVLQMANAAPQNALALLG